MIRGPENCKEEEPGSIEDSDEDSEMREESEEQGVDGEDYKMSEEVVPVEKIIEDKYKSQACREQFTFIKKNSKRPYESLADLNENFVKPMNLISLRNRKLSTLSAQQKKRYYAVVCSECKRPALLWFELKTPVGLPRAIYYCKPPYGMKMHDEHLN